MTTAADVTCYIQPVTARCEVMAWVDTSKTAVIRRTVSSKAEAERTIEEAKDVAVALGGNMAVKVIARTSSGSRLPAGVKRLQGTFIV